jgi:prevent-host-death family protein
MTREVPVTQARDELADLVNRVAYGDERVVLTRHGKPVAALVSPADLAVLQERDAGTQERIVLGSGAEPRPPARPAAAQLPLRIAAEHTPPAGGQPPRPPVA